MPTIGVIAGDGVGPEVVREALAVLEAVAGAEGFGYETVPFDIGGDRYLKSGDVLPDDVALEEIADLRGLGQFIEFDVVGVGEFLFDDLVAKIDALVTDIYAGARNELFNLLLTLSAERALQQVTAVSNACHGGEVLLPVRSR